MHYIFTAKGTREIETERSAVQCSAIYYSYSTVYLYSLVTGIIMINISASELSFNYDHGMKCMKYIFIMVLTRS